MSRTVGSQSSNFEKLTNVLTDEEKNNAERSSKFPRGIIYILATEFGERFSFYCFQGILTLYLTQELLFSDHSAASIFHAFMVLAYISPILGAMVADGWLGLYQTILYISILFAIGNAIVAIGASPMGLQDMTIISLFGLIIVALGTGGIKPCVSAFGGKQFEKGQTLERHRFFSYYFFAINVGSILSTVISPEFRATVHCFGKHTCYPLAFGFPALLSAITVTVFICGRHLYKIKPPEGSVLISVCACILYALVQKLKNKDKEKRNHWLEYADDKFDEQLIFDIKSFLQVLWMYIPLPIYWALYEQQGSTWVLQSAAMDGEFGGYRIKPDQMQIFNPIFILIFIPLFDSMIYPLLMKCGLCKKPLQRMAMGMVMTSIAFLMAGFIQLEIEKELPDYPPKGVSELTIINNSPCKLQLKSHLDTSVEAFKAETLRNIPSSTDFEWEVTPSECSAANKTNTKFRLSEPFECMMVALSNDRIDIRIGSETKVKDHSGRPRVKVHFSIDYVFNESEKASILFEGRDGKYFVNPDDLTPPSKVGSTKEYKMMQSGFYLIYLPLNESAHQEEAIGRAEFRDGGSYVVGIHQDSFQNKTKVTVFVTVLYNSIHVLYQLPQIIFLTAGEIMFEVTGLDFSFVESPRSLTSVVQGFWYLTNGLGNLCFVFIKFISPLQKKSHEFFLYVIIMLTSLSIFCILSLFFVYVDDRINKTQVE